jgi:DNA repair photolyase
MTKNYTNPLSLTSQFHFCGLPLRLDSYRGCAFQCYFCFARHRGGASPDPTVTPADPQFLRRVLRRSLVARSTKAPGILAGFLQRRVPVHFGGMSDPFQPAEQRHRVTLEFLGALRDYQYPTVISTRSTLVGAEPYRSTLRDMMVAVQFSFTSTRPRVASAIEPHVAAPSELLRTMLRLSNDGVPVLCRWQPYIGGYCEPPKEFVRRVTNAGARHLALEHLKVPLERGNPLWEKMSDAVKSDLRATYVSLGATRDGREYVLPAHRKLDAVLATRAEAHDHGATFGAADNEFQYISDTGCCCSGADQLPGFQNWFAHQFGQAVRRCRQHERILYGAISRDWVPEGSIDRWVNSHTRISRRTNTVGTIRNHLRQRWNNPASPLSPSMFYGVESTEQFTRQGYRIYRWNSVGAALVRYIQPLLGPPENQSRVHRIR